MGVGSNKPKVMFIIDNKKNPEDIIDGMQLLYLETCLKEYDIPKNAIYITPYVKCQRLPTKTAIKTCKSWLEEEVLYFKPELVVTFGKIDFPSNIHIPVSLTELSKNPKGPVTMKLFNEIKRINEFSKE